MLLGTRKGRLIIEMEGVFTLRYDKYDTMNMVVCIDDGDHLDYFYMLQDHFNTLLNATRVSKSIIERIENLVSTCQDLIKLNRIEDWNLSTPSIINAKPNLVSTYKIRRFCRWREGPVTGTGRRIRNWKMRSTDLDEVPLQYGFGPLKIAADWRQCRVG